MKKYFVVSVFLLIFAVQNSSFYSYEFKSKHYEKPNDTGMREFKKLNLFGVHSSDCSAAHAPFINFKPNKMQNSQKQSQGETGAPDNNLKLITGPSKTEAEIFEALENFFHWDHTYKVNDEMMGVLIALMERDKDGDMDNQFYADMLFTFNRVTTLLHKLDELNKERRKVCNS